MLKAPKTLKAAGRALWRQITRDYRPEDGAAAALLSELCAIHDRLTEVRDTLATEGLTIGSGEDKKRHPLADLEPKLSGQFRMLWKLAGLGEDIDAQRRPVGRPAESDRETPWES